MKVKTANSRTLVRKIRTVARSIALAIDYRRDMDILGRLDQSGELHELIIAARNELAISILERR